MRSVDPLLQTKLDSGATTLCRCWLVELTNGTKLGFTDHDNDLIVDGQSFEARGGMDASALEATSGLAVDNSSAVGVLSSSSIDAESLRAGKFDNATITISLVDWTDTSLQVTMFTGFLGEIKSGQVDFEVELRGLSELMNRKLGRSFIPSCDRTLGDMACGFNFSQQGFFVDASVESQVGNRTIFVSGISGFSDNWFGHGKIEWHSGENAGTTSVVKLDRNENGKRRLELWQETHRNVVAGDTFRVVAGCDKSFACCRDKFQNSIQFRGFPQMPGEDFVSAYPVAGQGNDGGSLN